MRIYIKKQIWLFIKPKIMEGTGLKLPELVILSIIANIFGYLTVNEFQ